MNITQAIYKVLYDWNVAHKSQYLLFQGEEKFTFYKNWNTGNQRLY